MLPDIMHFSVSAPVLSPQIGRHDMFKDPGWGVLAAAIGLSDRWENIHLQLHCPEGQAQEAPQLQEHPGP